MFEGVKLPFQVIINKHKHENEIKVEFLNNTSLSFSLYTKFTKMTIQMQYYVDYGAIMFQ